MKSRIIFGVVALLTVTSCAKNYVCECTEPSGSGNKHYDLKVRKKSEAEAYCEGQEGYAYGYYFTCELK